jgi:hypothetical protein
MGKSGMGNLTVSPYQGTEYQEHRPWEYAIGQEGAKVATFLLCTPPVLLVAARSALFQLCTHCGAEICEICACANRRALYFLLNSKPNFVPALHRQNLLAGAGGQVSSAHPRTQHLESGGRVVWNDRGGTREQNPWHNREAWLRNHLVVWFRENLHVREIQ